MIIITQPDMRKSVATAQRLVSTLPKQVRFAGSQAINASLASAIRASRERMAQVFDKPTPYTLRGAVVATTATRDTLQGTLGLNTQQAGANVPAGKPVLAEVQGGSRRAKRSEVLLQRAGVLPAGWLTVPGKAARTDAYGNIAIGQLLEVLAWFKVFGTSSAQQQRRGNRNAQRSNISDAGAARKRLGTRNRAGLEYFAVKPGEGGRLKPGIYARQLAGRFHGPVGNRPRPVLIFVPRTQYSKRFDFVQQAQAAVLASFPAAYAAAFRNALATAR